MDSVIEKKVIGRTVSRLLPRVVTISTIVVYAVKWTLASMIERYNAMWVVHGFLRFLDVHSIRLPDTHLSLRTLPSWFWCLWLYVTNCI